MKKFFLAALILSSATAAFAGNAYVGVTVSPGHQKMSESDVSEAENSTAVGVNAGYQFTPLFGLEGGYMRFGNATTKAGDYDIGANAKTFYLAGTATYRPTPRVALFAKVGAARSDTDSFVSYRTMRQSADTKSTGGLFGIGASYTFSNSVAVVLEYTDFGTIAKEGGLTVKVSEVAAGLRYSF